MLKFYNPEDRTVVLPIDLRNEHGGNFDLKKWQLEQMGFTTSWELDMPVDMGIRFYSADLPEWLNLAGDLEEANYYRHWSFEDADERIRLAVMMLGAPNTIAVTRYFPTEYFTPRSISKPAVQDRELEGDGINDKESMVWIGKEPKGKGWLDAKEKAVEWLEENYPDWQDPMAYWTKSE